MKCVRFSGAWKLELEDVPEPAPPVGDQVLVKIQRSTICGTDLGIVAGLYEASAPLTLGHEAAGIVAAVGESVTTLRSGDRVAIDPTFFCLQCRACRMGLTNHCRRKVGTETGVSRDGTFAPYYLTQERFLYRLEDGVTFEEACFTEPLSCVLTGLRQLRLRSDLPTVVYGGGPMGMLYAHALRARGIIGAILEISPQRRALCEGLAPHGWLVAESLDDLPKSFLPEGKLDLAVETTGVMLGDLLPRCERGAQVLLVGLRPGNVMICPKDLTDQSISLIGSIDTQGTFAEALALIARRVIPVGTFITETFALEQYRQAFASLGCDLQSRSLKPTSRALKIAFAID